MLCETSGYPRMTVLMGKVKWSILFSGKPILWLLWATKCNKPRIDFPTKRGGPANSLMPKLVSNKNIKQGILCSNLWKCAESCASWTNQNDDAEKCCKMMPPSTIAAFREIFDAQRQTSKRPKPMPIWGSSHWGGPNDWMVIPPLGKPTSR
jgi:hypothetical protein